MAVCVIVVFKIVNIDENNGDRCFFTEAPFPFQAQGFIKKPPVGQSCESVKIGLTLQVFFELFFIGYIAEGDGKAIFKIDRGYFKPG